MSQISIFISLIALVFNIIVLCVAKKEHDEASQVAKSFPVSWRMLLGVAAAVSPYKLLDAITKSNWKSYLFIIDNTDGHKMLAKELTAFLVNRIQSKNRSHSASRKGAVK